MSPTTSKSVFVFAFPVVFLFAFQVGRIQGGIAFLEGVGFVSRIEETPTQLLGGSGRGGGGRYVPVDDVCETSSIVNLSIMSLKRRSRREA